MKTAGIIAEYDPFHAGHAWQIRQAREQGAECVAVCMSGDLVQRGSAALLPPWVRAQAAVRGGADLVIELPNPYACLSAEGFASAGVFLLSALPSVDSLVFGAEQSDCEMIWNAAELLLSQSFQLLLAVELASGLSFAAARAAAAESLLHGSSELLAKPNNNLGVEYCKAILRQKSHLKPFPMERRGAQHGQKEAGEEGFASASFLRERWSCGRADGLEGWVPEEALELYRQESSQAIDRSRLELALLSRLRGMDREQLAATRGTAEGLENLLANAMQKAVTLEELYDSMKSKRYAHARLRRYVLDAALGYTDELPQTPPYIHILAANAKGMALLKGAELPAGASLARLARQSREAAAVAKAHQRGADLCALCRRVPQPMGQSFTRPCYLEK